MMNWYAIFKRSFLDLDTVVDLYDDKTILNCLNNDSTVNKITNFENYSKNLGIDRLTISILIEILKFSDDYFYGQSEIDLLDLISIYINNKKFKSIVDNFSKDKKFYSFIKMEEKFKSWRKRDIDPDINGDLFYIQDLSKNLEFLKDGNVDAIFSYTDTVDIKFLENCRIELIDMLEVAISVLPYLTFARNLKQKKAKNLPHRLHSNHRDYKSFHELIVKDIFDIINVSYEEEVQLDPWKPSKCNYSIGPRVDFANNNKYLELFGIHDNEKYDVCKIEKIKHIKDLSWLDFPKGMKPPKKRTLLQYAGYLDGLQTNGQVFISDVTELLMTKVPLLSREDLCKSYIDFLNNINNNYPVRNEYQNKMKISQIKMKPSIEDITNSLKQYYSSVDYWSDSEKVAVYFNNEQNILPYIKTQSLPLKNVANKIFQI